MLTEGAGWSGSQRNGTSAARLIRGPRRRLRERLLQRSEQREAARGRSGRRGGAGALLGRDSGVVEGRGRGGAGSAPGGEIAEGPSLGGGEDGRLREAQGCGANLRGPRASWGGAPRERSAGIAAVIAGGRCGRRRTTLTRGVGLPVGWLAGGAGASAAWEQAECWGGTGCWRGCAGPRLGRPG